MNTRLVTAVLFMFLSTSHAAQPNPIVAASAQVAGCDRCGVILSEIRDVLIERCDTAPSLDDLRNQPIYLFLSIFDEVSQGGDKAMAERVYNAALEGMECDNTDAGVKAAQQMANQLMVESRT